MGYSCTAKAMNTFKAIEKRVCTDARPSNQWTHKGKIYFSEIGGEKDDGAVVGSIWVNTKMVGDVQYVKRAGTFRINPDGSIARFPYVPRNVKIESEKEGMSSIWTNY